VFGISFEELIVLLVLAFILFGPQKLPEYAEKLGRLVAKLRQASTELSQQCSEWTQQTNPLKNPAEPPPLLRDATCPQCHQKLDLDFTFCPYCGRRLKDSPGPQQSLAS
jgi:TatA/E family protein of Tat protein translocase